MNMKIVSTFKIKVKPNEIMGDYIALHGMVPQNELPVPLRWEIPKDEIWIRSNVYNDIERRRAVLGHEECELNLMVNEGLSYKGYTKTSFAV